MPKLWQRSHAHSEHRRGGRRRTTISLSVADLAALGLLLAAGSVLLQDRAPKTPAIGRLKAAMTRLGVPIPSGL
jgi:hypothetical protein